jgi:integrase
MSIRKRTWRTTKGVEKAAWVVDYVDQKGKRHLKSFAKKKAADSFAATASVEVRQGIHTADSASITIAEAGKLWLQSGEAKGLERSTLAAYRQHLDLHIVPILGAVKLSQLSAPMVRDFEVRLAAGDWTGQTRSMAMVKKARLSLSSLISDAQERGLVARNVVRELRRSRHRGAERRAEKRQRGKLKIGVDLPSPQEMRAIVEHLKGRWRPLLLTAIFTGLRASELRGLRWADVDFGRGELHIRQRADRYSAIGKPKSEAGERTVPLTPIVLKTLREWRLVCEKSDEGLVFPSVHGRVQQHAHIIRRGLIPAQIAGGVVHKTGERDSAGTPIVAAKYTGLHALRHFYASWCINRRADGGLQLPPKLVQERLGHSSIMMTMDVYGHLFPRGDDAAELAEAERSILGLDAT